MREKLQKLLLGVLLIGIVVFPVGFPRDTGIYV